MSRVIYSKKYPKFDIEETGKELENLSEQERLEKVFPPADVFFKKLEADSVYVLMPHRMVLKDTFIKAAINFSEQYEIDAEIVEKMGVIQVSLSFDRVGFMGRMKSVIMMADDIAFFSGKKDRDITVVLDFYTHLHFSKSGRLIAPR